MRVISGKYKNRPLYHPKAIRPSTQKHKKQVFDTLRNDIADTKILDLFTGSGQMGIEALSLGANHVVFVDQSNKSTDFVKKNLSNLNIEPEQFQVITSTLSSYIQNNHNQFNIIIADPPYHTIDWNEFSNIDKLAAPLGLFVLKYSPHNPPPDFPHWRLLKQKDCRDTIINFYLISKD